jgi:hypothetical protein
MLQRRTVRGMQQDEALRCEYRRQHSQVSQHRGRNPFPLRDLCIRRSHRFSFRPEDLRATFESRIE